jgi:glycosyltransferase involved in cell wall biosynthesis
MSETLVTVVITTYKRPDLLPYSIDSVLKQTYRSIELIVVDDNGEGTQDQLRTADVIESIADPRLSYHVLKQNSGPSAARNAGIIKASGIYVAFLDDDDLMLPEKIEKQIRYMQLKSEGCCGCGSWLRRFYENGFAFDVKPPDGIDVFLAAIKREQTYSTCTLMIKRTALLEIGMFDEEFRGLEDPELVTRLSLRYEFGIVEEVLTLVRTRDEVESADWHEKWSLKLIGKYEKEIGRLSPRVKREIYFNCYFNLVKKYLQNRKYKKAFHYFLCCGNPLKGAVQLISSTFVYIRKKRAVS